VLGDGSGRYGMEEQKENSAEEQILKDLEEEEEYDF